MLNKYLKILVFAVCLISLIEVISAAEGGTQNVRVNVLPEYLIVNSPVNGKTYDNSLIDINITLDVLGLKVDYIKWSFDKHTWRTLCTDCNEYGLSSVRNRAFKEGDNEIEFRLMSYTGKILQEKTVKFSVDSKKPVIHRTKPSSGSTTNGDGFYVQYTEDNLKEINLYYAGKKITKTSAECPPGRKEECYFDVNLSKYSNNWIEYYFTVSDFASTESSKPAAIFVDINDPGLIINSPKSIDYTSRTIPINLTTTEYSKIIEYMDLEEKSPSWKKLCYNCNEFGFNKNKKITFSNGAHNLLIKATDYAGNSKTKGVTFNVMSRGLFFW
ncbi:MAG: hypothetical protein PHF67_03525 [Candidatus Nanoarchaeia archaeon]|nr:hypothetical protein [Candidatus Nanoarchaeia archaeon]